MEETETNFTLSPQLKDVFNQSIATKEVVFVRSRIDVSDIAEGAGKIVKENGHSGSATYTTSVSPFLSSIHGC